jgi:hypothetical protein
MGVPEAPVAPVGTKGVRPGSVPRRAPGGSEKQVAAAVLRGPVVRIAPAGVRQPLEYGPRHDQVGPSADPPAQRGPAGIEAARRVKQIEIRALPGRQDHRRRCHAGARLGEARRQGVTIGKIQKLVTGVEHPGLGILPVVSRQPHVHETFSTDEIRHRQVSDAERQDLHLALRRLHGDLIAHGRPGGGIVGRACGPAHRGDETDERSAPQATADGAPGSVEWSSVHDCIKSKTEADVDPAHILEVGCFRARCHRSTPRGSMTTTRPASYPGRGVRAGSRAGRSRSRRGPGGRRWRSRPGCRRRWAG